MRHARGQHEKGSGAELVVALRRPDLDMTSQDLDRDQPVGDMVDESAVRLEVEQHERHRPLVGDRYLPMPVRGRMRLRSQLPRDLGEVVDVLGTGESLDGCAAQPRLLLLVFHACASSRLLIGSQCTGPSWPPERQMSSIVRLG